MVLLGLVYGSMFHVKHFLFLYRCLLVFCACVILRLLGRKCHGTVIRW